MILKKKFKLGNNAVFGKFMENVRKHQDVKLVTSEKGRNYSVSQRNYHSKENLLAIEMRKTQIVINKLVQFDLSRLGFQ